MKLQVNNFSNKTGFKFIQHENIKDSSVICLEELIDNFVFNKNKLTILSR